MDRGSSEATREAERTEFDALPGGDLVRTGLEDLRRGEETDASLLVSIAATKLRAFGFELAHPYQDAEHRLYLRLAERFGDAAHGRYNALVRRLVSFERALACVRS